VLGFGRIAVFNLLKELNAMFESAWIAPQGDLALLVGETHSLEPFVHLGIAGSIESASK
jgi:hypothetical protein